MGPGGRCKLIRYCIVGMVFNFSSHIKGRTDMRAASEGVQSGARDRSSEAGYPTLFPTDHDHDPRNFYASDSPVFEDSDLEQEYKSAEEFGGTLETEKQDSLRVGGRDISICNHPVREFRLISKKVLTIFPEPDFR